MITISEVIEACAQECESFPDAAAIRALAAQYEGCIVAESAPEAWMSPGREIFAPVRHDTVFGSHTIALYRAKEPTK
jgi:hypothetical protein